MSKEDKEKVFARDNGFRCIKCNRIVIDGKKHKNEEDICDSCQIAELKAKNAMLSDLNNQYATQLEQKHNKQPNLQNLCNKLQQQLKEKDEEIRGWIKDYYEQEKLKEEYKEDCLRWQKLAFNYNKQAKIIFNLKQDIESNTKQVCEKIRKNSPHYFCNRKGAWNSHCYEIPAKLLDQIEKGE